MNNLKINDILISHGIQTHSHQLLYYSFIVHTSEAPPVAHEPQFVFVQTKCRKLVNLLLLKQFNCIGWCGEYVRTGNMIEPE